MSDLAIPFVVSAGVTASGHVYATTPVDADLVGVTLAVDAAGANASTLDVKVAGTSIFATAANVVASGDAGASITANQLQVAGDSASKVAKAASVDALTRLKNASDPRVVTNNVTSGVDFIGSQRPADPVLASVTAGQVIDLNVTKGASANQVVVGLLFIRK